jgi:GTP-binding protein
VIDVSNSRGRPDPVKDFEVIMGELSSFGAQLEKKPMLVVASKIDAMQEGDGLPPSKGRGKKSSARASDSIAAKKSGNTSKLGRLSAFCKRKKLELYPISAVTGEGIAALKFALARKVEQLRAKQEIPA